MTPAAVVDTVGGGCVTCATAVAVACEFLVDVIAEEGGTGAMWVVVSGAAAHEKFGDQPAPIESNGVDSQPSRLDSLGQALRL